MMVGRDFFPSKNCLRLGFQLNYGQKLSSLKLKWKNELFRFGSQLGTFPHRRTQLDISIKKSTHLFRGEGIKLNFNLFLPSLAVWNTCDIDLIGHQMPL
jgi:hypothetical protein